MTTEREELRLTVSLVDNVSAGLNKIKGEFKDLTEGGGKKHAEQFKRENTEAVAVIRRMTGEAGEAYKAFGMMRLGALGAAGGVALLGFEVAKQVKEWGELAEKVRSANQVARAFGIDPSAMRNIQEQLEAAGVSAEQSQGALTKFLDTMGELQRNPAFRANILQQTLEGNVPAMAARLKQIEEAKTATEKLNLTRQLGIDVEEKALARGESPERAAGERSRLEAMLGYNQLALGVAGQLKELTEEQRKAEEARSRNLEHYANLLGEIKKEWGEIGRLLDASVFKEDGFVVQGALKIRDAVVQIKETLEFIQHHGLGDYLNPFSQASQDRSKHDFEEKMKERNEAEEAGKTPEDREREARAAAAKEAAEEAKRKAKDATTQQQLQDRMEHLRKLGMPQYFSGSGADITANMPESSNIEDRRGEFDDRAKYMKENTAELKRLNDFLIGPAATGPGGVGGYGFLSGGAGGGGGFAQRLGLGAGGAGGINIPGAGAGAGVATAGSADAGAGVGQPAPPRNQRGAALYKQLLTEFQKNPPKGLPPDAVRFGITKGTPEEWARFGVSVAHAESGFDPKSANTSDPGGSFGVFQYAHNQVPGGNAYDVDASVKAFVRDANTSAGDRGGLRGGILGQRFSTIGKHPERGAAYLRQASELGGSAAGAAGHIQPGAVSAVGGADPSAFIFHHTSGRGSIEGLKETLRQRHLGVEYAMDRDGNIVQIGGPGSSHMKTGWGPLGKGLSNRNTVGMEVIAKNDRDVTPAQIAAAKVFMERNYPNTPVFGHGQVNPGHKEADEGMSIVNAVRARRSLDQSNKTTVEGSGKITVDVNAPKGTRVGAQGKGLFKDVEINRQTQMEPARRGPEVGEE